MASTTKKRNAKTKSKSKPVRQNGKASTAWDAIFSNGPTVPAVEFARWTEYLAKRKKPVPLRKLFPHSSASPLLWGLPARIHTHSCLLDLVRETNRLKKKAGVLQDSVLHDWLDSWLVESDTRGHDDVHSLECLTWAYALPQLADSMPAQSWHALFLHLLGTVDEGNVAVNETSPWTRALVTSELPLALAYHFPESSACRTLAKPAAKFLSRSLMEWLDGQGLIHCDRLDIMRPLLATWTRSICLAQCIDKVKVSKSAIAEFEWFVQQVLRLTRCDLTAVMSPAGETATKEAFADMMESALVLTDDKCDTALLNSVLHANAPRSIKEPREHHLPAGPSYQSDWSELAVLQTDWSPKEPRLTIAHSQSNLRSEFSIGEEIVFAGEVQREIKINGQLAQVANKWECVCWFSDDDVDLFELRTELTNNWHLERQILMARDDKFLLMADIITGDSVAEIDYRCTLPLSDGITFDPAGETREGILKGRRRLGLVLPLALPEWRTDPRFGSLTGGANGLELHQSATGRGLYAPLFIDFHRRRMRTATTWRQLTIAEDLEIVPLDQAVGYRVQVGMEQWLFYRSLLPTTSRSLLGQHLGCEFLCARFLHDGTAETLVEIAADTSESADR